MSIGELYALYTEAEKFSNGENHGLVNWRVVIDCLQLLESYNEFDESAKEKLASKMRAFITRKKLGIPITVRSINKEFDNG